MIKTSLRKYNFVIDERAINKIIDLDPADIPKTNFINVDNLSEEKQLEFFRKVKKAWELKR